MRRRCCAAVARLAAATAVCTLVAACVTLTEEPRGLTEDSEGVLRVAAIACGALPPPDGSRRAAALDPRALDPGAIRLVTWNLHKQGDHGWNGDLAQFAAQSDVVLLQEAVLGAGLRPVLDNAGLRWVMASSFIYRNDDFGVLTAARVAPLASCALRAVEPLLGIPKSGLVAWFALAGDGPPLAVVNVHAINFALTVDGYRAQFEALAATLAAHRGPIVFAGDFNTWSEARQATVRSAVAALGLVEVPLPDDRRTRFLGQPVDHVLVRGLDVVGAIAVDVTSSDHNPVLVTLRLPAPR